MTLDEQHSAAVDHMEIPTTECTACRCSGFVMAAATTFDLLVTCAGTTRFPYVNTLYTTCLRLPVGVLDVHPSL
jgi:hypothetical protein